MNKTKIDRALSELLERACPSIQYRLRAEILHQPGSTPEMAALQHQILEDEAVKEVIGWQQPDGWLGWSFHGDRGAETGIRLLCEKGVAIGNPVLAKALQALAAGTDRLNQGIGKPGEILDTLGLGGSQAIRAAVFAYAGCEAEPFVQEQLEQALAAFRAVLSADGLSDLAETYRGKLVFRPGSLWPSIYHLRLLAHTCCWRAPGPQGMIAKSIGRLVKLSPLPAIYARHGSQLVAPASFCMDDFNPNLAALDSAHWMMWFHRMELLNRLGVIDRIPELARQVEILEGMLDAAGGKFTRALAHAYFRNWGPYTGLMLERDWRDPQRRINDLTFRSLLILHSLQTLTG